jgi:hypothetical protein
MPGGKTVKNRRIARKMAQSAQEIRSALRSWPQPATEHPRHAAVATAKKH